LADTVRADAMSLAENWTNVGQSYNGNDHDPTSIRNGYGPPVTDGCSIDG